MTNIARTEDERSLRPIRARGPFVKWLEAQPSDRVFGESTRDCALAKFCHGQVGWCSYDGGSLPDWAVEFVKRFVRGTDLSVGRALTIMKALP